MAEKYIEMKMTELMAQAAFANLQPAAVVDAEGVPHQQQKSKDMGAFEVRAGLRGGLKFMQRELVYKAIGSTQPDLVREVDDAIGPSYAAKTVLADTSAKQIQFGDHG